VGTPLGSAKIDTPTIGDGESQQFPVAVQPGATKLRATIGSPADIGADLDLSVYDCTSGSCVLAGQSADGDSEESTTIDNPAPGQWVVLVQGYAVPEGSTTYEYVDVFSGPEFGSVSIDDSLAERAAGASWTVSGTVTANIVPQGDRVLLGNVEVHTDEGVLVGTSDVILENVTE
jgi:hypothetical protein